MDTLMCHNILSKISTGKPRMVQVEVVMERATYPNMGNSKLFSHFFASRSISASPSRRRGLFPHPYQYHGRGS